MAFSINIKCIYIFKSLMYDCSGGENKENHKNIMKLSSSPKDQAKARKYA